MYGKLLVLAFNDFSDWNISYHFRFCRYSILQGILVKMRQKKAVSSLFNHFQFPLDVLWSSSDVHTWQATHSMAGISADTLEPPFNSHCPSGPQKPFLYHFNITPSSLAEYPVSTELSQQLLTSASSEHPDHRDKTVQRHRIEIYSTPMSWRHAEWMGPFHHDVLLIQCCGAIQIFIEYLCLVFSLYVKCLLPKC